MSACILIQSPDPIIFKYEMKTLTQKVWKIELSMRKSMRFKKRYGKKYEVNTKFPTKNEKSMRFCPKSMRIWPKKQKKCQKRPTKSMRFSMRFNEKVWEAWE